MRNGEVNGYGCFYDRSGKMVSGIWVNNRLQNWVMLVIVSEIDWIVEDKDFLWFIK